MTAKTLYNLCADKQTQLIEPVLQLLFSKGPASSNHAQSLEVRLHILPLDADSSVYHRNEQFIGLLRLAHLSEPLMHEAAGLANELIQCFICVHRLLQELQKPLHLLGCLRLMFREASLTVRIYLQSLEFVELGVVHLLLVTVDVAALDHNSAVLTTLVDGLLDQCADEVIQAALVRLNERY